eukprot:1368580-Amorphochlora_amoeboformis.AAC.2
MSHIQIISEPTEIGSVSSGLIWDTCRGYAGAYLGLREVLGLSRAFPRLCSRGWLVPANFKR